MTIKQTHLVISHADVHADHFIVGNKAVILQQITPYMLAHLAIQY